VKSSSEPLDLMISNKPIGQGETVKVGENFGVKITRIGDAKQIMQAVTGR
jgi:flagellar motor switch/type III secretory pathway protein FliN